MDDGEVRPTQHSCIFMPAGCSSLILIRSCVLRRCVRVCVRA